VRRGADATARAPHTGAAAQAPFIPPAHTHTQASRDAMVSLQRQLETQGTDSAEEVQALHALLEHGADRHAGELQAAR
jgi:hypothetical protein